ncbi:Hypothetical protein, putative [Bodo saltans]|uniref:Uncharacterized protein n=1 Tax=Bodo saltans TaxID=75058 RepID=A0A0S4J7Y7_BODSA|nr:Hypothetical protein, putative [Bodo saltans]|eukprot:CUG79307.1 Hypothetical protein, putative [Bodo saltans]
MCPMFVPLISCFQTKKFKASQSWVTQSAEQHVSPDLLMTIVGLWLDIWTSAETQLLRSQSHSSPTAVIRSHFTEPVTLLECPKLFTPHHLKPTGAIIFFPTNDLKKSSTRYIEDLESHDDVVRGTYKLELVCLPKPGAIVKPVSLHEASRQQNLFAERDVLEPSVRNCGEIRPVKFSNDLRELGYSVMSTWEAPGIWPVQFTFTHSKNDTRSSAARITKLRLNSLN